MLLGFLGLALDWGYTLWVAGQLQNAADASALAGAQQVYDSHSAARTAAINIASANYAAGSVQLWPNPTNESDGDGVVGFYDADTRTFTSTDQANANAVYVLARRNEGAKAGALPLFFGPIFGKDTADVVRFAIAVAEGGPNYASVIALNPSDPKTFHLQGNAALFVSGAVQVDSTHRQAAYYNGTPITFTADEVNIVGEHDIKGRPNLPDQNDFEPYVADPLADLPQPAVPGSATYPAKPKPPSRRLHPEHRVRNKRPLDPHRLRRDVLPQPGQRSRQRHRSGLHHAADRRCLREHPVLPGAHQHRASRLQRHDPLDRRADRRSQHTRCR
jgi:hypothetical protein